MTVEDIIANAESGLFLLNSSIDSIYDECKVIARFDDMEDLVNDVEENGSTKGYPEDMTVFEFVEENPILDIEGVQQFYTIENYEVSTSPISIDEYIHDGYEIEEDDSYDYDD